jgi:hypothetical protein
VTRIKVLDPPETAVGPDGLLRTFSNGGGVQSTAVTVLSAHGVLPYRHHLFSNVGDDSEHPGSVQFVRLILQPYAAHHGIVVEEIKRVFRDGRDETLLGRLVKPGSRSLPIPVRMPDTGAPGTRSCTADFKLKVIARWLKQHGATVDRPARVGVGISTDEAHRANTRRAFPHETPEYPLLGLLVDGEQFGVRFRRQDCQRTIRNEWLPAKVAGDLWRMDAEATRQGWKFDPFDPSTWTKAIYEPIAVQLRESAFTTMPIPPKSSCYFCPFHRPSTWQAMRIEEPALFDASAALEDLLNERRDLLGKDHVYLTRFGAPLRDVIPAGVEMLPFADDTGDGDGECDNGACFT